MRCEKRGKSRGVVRPFTPVGAPIVIGANAGALTCRLHPHKARVGWLGKTKLATPSPSACQQSKPLRQSTCACLIKASAKHSSSCIVSSEVPWRPCFLPMVAVINLRIMRPSCWSTAGEIHRLVGDTSGPNPFSYACCIEMGTVEATSTPTQVGIWRA
jgi:hypothetical protein